MTPTQSSKNSLNVPLQPILDALESGNRTEAHMGSIAKKIYAHIPDHILREGMPLSRDDFFRAIDYIVEEKISGSSINKGTGRP